MVRFNFYQLLGETSEHNIEKPKSHEVLGDIFCFVKNTSSFLRVIARVVIPTCIVVSHKDTLICGFAVT